ncbi:MAG: NUDIX domain-containing protein [Halobacteriales archaeon]|nr:NUDIX domain-containing protein [Halobacteriales archaeon]
MTSETGRLPPVHEAAPAGVRALAAQAREYTVIVAVRQGLDGRQFLMVRHRERGWELPGGKIEPGEGPVHCALREFREETGHLLGAPHFVTKIKKPNGTCFVFTGGLGPEAEGNDPGDGEAIEGMEWFARLPREQKLAFPDDPYDEMGALLGIEFG